jgi:putative ATP-dependent endonuclease of OLD family
LGADESSISIVPIGGRHVNHFWRLLNGLGIPHVTLLDLDVGRHGGGWGRLKYAIEQLIKFGGAPEIAPNATDNWPKWDAADPVLATKVAQDWCEYLRGKNVFFSAPLDLDFMMIRCFPNEYGIEAAELAAPGPGPETIKAVLGKSHGDAGQYSVDGLKLFAAYHRIFKLSSKPAAHLAAMAEVDEQKFILGMPEMLRALMLRVGEMLKGLPE